MESPIVVDPSVSASVQCRLSSWWRLCVVLGATAAACSRPAEQAAPVPSSAPQALEQAPQYPPPHEAFKAPAPWQSSKPGAEPIAPPDLGPETWRVFVTQNQPLQIKTPVWQPLPPQENVEVAMPPGTRFRCLVSPLSVASETNDFNTKLLGWLMIRTLRCSDDAWRSWTEYSHAVRLPHGGEREMLSVPQALLRERDPDQRVRETFVVLRSDKENREATTGPPRIVLGRTVDED